MYRRFVTFPPVFYLAKTLLENCGGFADRKEFSVRRNFERCIDGIYT